MSREGQDEGGWLGLWKRRGGGSSHPGIPAERRGEPAARGPRESNQDRMRTSHCCLFFDLGLAGMRSVGERGDAMIGGFMGHE